jgi:hypothetical protein
MKPASDSGESFFDGLPRLIALYGIAADVFQKLGGGENFIRKERELLNFRREADSGLLS